MVSVLDALNNILKSILMTDNPNSFSCTPESPDYSLLTPEEKQRFGYIVHQLIKQGMSLKLAQELAYSGVMCEDVPFGDPTGR